MMSKKKVSRRDFLRKTGSGATGTAVALASIKTSQAAPAALDVDPATVVAALGDVLIPSDPGDPGYKTLEPYNITAEVMKDWRVSDEELVLLNSQAGQLFPGKTFLQLKETEQESYFDSVFSGDQGEDLRRTLLSIRRRVFQVFYKNYPEHALPRDSQGAPILSPGDTHQITNPNTKGLATGWDVSGFMGPLSWEEEQRRRSIVEKIDWIE
jgi:hypothetical protein